MYRAGLLAPLIRGFSGETPKEFHEKDGMRIAAHVRYGRNAHLRGAKQFAGSRESNTMYLFENGVSGGSLESDLGLAARTPKIFQYVGRRYPFTSMPPNGFKRGRDMRVDYLQFPTGCPPNELCNTESATLSFLGMSLDDLVQQLRARKTCTVEIKSDTAEWRHGVLAKYLLVVDGDDRYLVRYGHAFGGTSRKYLVSHVVVDRENAARLAQIANESTQLRLTGNLVCLCGIPQDANLPTVKPHDFLKSLAPVGTPRHIVKTGNIRVRGTFQRKEFLGGSFGSLYGIVFHAMAVHRRFRVAIKIDERKPSEQPGRVDVFSRTGFNDDAAWMPERNQSLELRLRRTICGLDAPPVVLGISANSLQPLVDRRLPSGYRADE